VLRKALAILAIIAAPALAITAADKAALQSQLDAMKATVSALPIDAPAWASVKPDVLDIDFVNVRSVLDAKWQDGNIGYDGAGTAIHYGNMAGPLPISNGVADYSQKFSNPSCAPRFLADPLQNNLKFLRACTDGTGAIYNGSTCAVCRLIYWDFNGLTPRPEYYVRFMVRNGQVTYDNQTDLGIKFPGLAGDQLEIGPKLPVGNELQTYRYGFESGTGFGVVEKFGFVMLPGRWYTIEEHDRANTVTNGVYNKDGLIEVKVDGKLIWVRNNVQQYGPPSIPAVRSLLVQFYHGGLIPPKGRLEIDFARLAICKSAWCGPSIEAAP
jgi:hypothetical protein